MNGDFDALLRWDIATNQIDSKGYIIAISKATSSQRQKVAPVARCCLDQFHLWHIGMNLLFLFLNFVHAL